MANLKDYEEDIYKCSRCGLCQSVCPVYKATLNECAVSKGKFNMLNGVLKGELLMTPKIKMYLDLCTGCNACKDFCPSGIDARKIFVAARSEYYKNHKLGFLNKFLFSYSLFKTALCLLRIFHIFYNIFKFENIFKFFERFILKMGNFGKNFLLLRFLFKNNYPSRKNVCDCNKYLKTAIYFEGCFNKYINNETEYAVKKILENSGIKLLKKDFECCGISYLSDGNIDEFNKLLLKNLSKFDCDFDFVITDCASCNSVLKSYVDYFDSAIAKKLQTSTISVIELLKNMEFLSEKNFKIAIHKPCHEDFDILSIVSKIKNIEYIHVEDYDKCCGFSGTFALKNPKISKQISKSKVESYIKNGVDIVLTTCPACLLGLEQGFIETEISSDSRPVAMNLFVFLAKYCIQV